MVVIHTTPSKQNPPREGEKESRFTINAKVFDNLARNNGKPAFLFAKECVGGIYSVVTQAVKAGDAFLSGTGTYTKDHNALVSQNIELSSLTIAEDLKCAREAYYSHYVANQGAIAQPSTPSVKVAAVATGADVVANDAITGADDVQP